VPLSPRPQPAIEIVARGRKLDQNDMVCDYKALKCW